MSNLTDSEIVDEAAVLERVDGDRELLGHLVGMFFDDAPKVMATLESSIAQSDSNALSSAAHRLKGALLTLAANPAGEAALVLEKMGKHGDLSRATAALDTLRAELTRLTPVLEALRGR